MKSWYRVWNRHISTLKSRYIVYEIVISSMKSWYRLWNRDIIYEIVISILMEKKSTKNEMNKSFRQIFFVSTFFICLKSLKWKNPYFVYEIVISFMKLLYVVYDIVISSMKLWYRLLNPDIVYEILISSMKSWYRLWNRDIVYEIVKSSMKSWYCL